MSTTGKTIIIVKISLGNSVKILDNIDNGNISNEWIRVKYNNKEGYISKKYLDVIY